MSQADTQLTEFTLQESNYGPEFGWGSSAVMNAAIKSGTNSFHGDVWEYFRNQLFNANDYFTKQNQLLDGEPNEVGQYHENIFGGTIGGPVLIPKFYNGRNKTFFFFDWQGTRDEQPFDPQAEVPTANMRNSGFTNMQDVFSLFGIPASNPTVDALGRTFLYGTIFDPATTRIVQPGAVDPVSGFVNNYSYAQPVRDPFFTGGSVAGIKDFTGLSSQLNILPANRFDSNAVKLLDLHPAPTNNSVTVANYDQFLSENTSINQYDVRIDSVLSKRDTLFATYGYWNSTYSQPNVLPGYANGQNYSSGETQQPHHSISMGYTHVFSPTFTNEVHGGYVVSKRNLVSDDASTMGISGQFGIAGIPQVAGNGGLSISSLGMFSGLGRAGWLPTLISMRGVQFSDSVSKLIRNHSIRAGFQWSYSTGTMTQPPYAQGYFGYYGYYDDNPINNTGELGFAEMLLSPEKSTVPDGIDYLSGLSEYAASNFAAMAYARHNWGDISRMTGRSLRS